MGKQFRNIRQMAAYDFGINLPIGVICTKSVFHHWSSLGFRRSKQRSGRVVGNKPQQEDYTFLQWVRRRLVSAVIVISRGLLKHCFCGCLAVAYKNKVEEMKK